MAWFRDFESAVAEASRRAWLTGRRYRVRLDRRNGWWDLSETGEPVAGRARYREHWE